MIHICSKCEKVIKDGDRVSMRVESTYHMLKSSIAFALDKADLECDSDTLRHAHCPIGYEGD